MNQADIFTRVSHRVSRFTVIPAGLTTSHTVLNSMESFWCRECSNLKFEILVVDDNSPDGTACEYRRLQKALDPERLVSDNKL